MKDSLCVATYASGREYLEFIPVYIYSILKAYPDYEVVIFCAEILPDNIRNSLSYIEGMGAFSVEEGYLKHVPSGFDKKISAACKRWFVYSQKFKEYKYLYIGDIDVFILPEETPIHEQHLKHCEAIDLDYSNVRRRANGKRLSGLHFIKTEAYLERMLPVVEKYKKLYNNDKLHYENDENMLFDIISESGLGLCPRATDGEWIDPADPSFRPVHGIHLAVFRDFFVKKRRLSSKSFRASMRKLQVMVKDPVFEKIEQNFEAKMIKRIFKRVHKYDFSE
jgi:hypothetical protein